MSRFARNIGEQADIVVDLYLYLTILVRPYLNLRTHIFGRSEEMFCAED